MTIIDNNDNDNNSDNDKNQKSGRPSPLFVT